jgi:nitrogen regulatory protein PII
MRRIATVLKSSEAATVREAVKAAGASLVIVTPLSPHNGAVNLVMWYCDSASSGVDRPVRLEVIAEDANANANNIVSAILANARSGGIENIIPFLAGKLLQAVLPESKREARNV